MAGNAITISPLIPLTQPLETIQLAPASVENVSLKFAIPNNIGLLTAYDPLGNQIFIQSEPLALREPVDIIVKPSLPVIPIKEQQFIQPKQNTIFLENVQEKESSNYNQLIHPVTENKTDDMIVYQITYPEDLNLKTVKRGRTKNKVQEKQESVEKEIKQPPVKAPRTRSGRIVKTPKHIEKDFEKILITNEPEVKTAKFLSVEDDKEEKKDLQELEHHFKKKTVPSQFRCSFCKKAYFGKRAMYQHLLKNPSHGPLPDKNSNYDVWNYLVDITQKCPPGRRGVKFCEELMNLLNNLKLLSSALFKTNDTAKSTVQVDKLLGNAIGLQPGEYNFDENELYKDVSVLKLITNGQLFTANKTISSDINIGTKTMENEQKNNIQVAPKFQNAVKPCDIPKKIHNENEVTMSLVPFQENIPCLERVDMESPNVLASSQIKSLQINTENNEQGNINSLSFTQRDCIEDNNEKIGFREAVSNIIHESGSYPQNFVEPNFVSAQQSVDRFDQKSIPEAKATLDLKISDTDCIESFNKTIGDHVISGAFKKLEDTSLSLHSDLLSDNSLMALPNLRTTVDELMLSNVDTSSNLLDNSTSSDEVMNVDQFVNERFKKITEPDTDLKFNTSLNLDLPSLDMFQFHTS